MRHTLVTMLGLVWVVGCTAEEEAPGEDIRSTVASSSVETSSEEVCEPGFRIGRCPADFALPDSVGDLVSLHAQRGGRVAVIGSAEY
jgi:hypothetical protein